MDEAREALVFDGIIRRLSHIGYDVIPEDRPSIEFMLDYTLDYIKIQCNRSDVDESCDTAIIERVTAEFLTRKKNMGLLVDFDYDRGVKAITEGDTKVDYLTGSDAPTAESRFNKCLNEMTRGFDKKVISPFRKLRW